MNQEQKTVCRGIAVGLAFGVSFFLGIYFFYPWPEFRFESTGSRVLFAFRCQVIPAIALLFGIGLVANSRFLTDAINPITGVGNERFQIYLRYLQNTLEQFVLFSSGTTILASYLKPTQIKLVPTLAVLFLASRILFLIGYLRHPLYRAAGMAATMYPTIFVLLYDLYRLLRDGVGI